MSDLDSTTERVKNVLRVSLQLGSDVEIPDNMPLTGGEYDLDSLDLLLLVTNIEKEFGIKIPNETLGPHVFENVSSVAAFVEGIQSRG